VAVYGGGRESVATYTHKIYWELQNIMRLANSRNLKEITADKVIVR
jgi:isopentenyl diphosphate isomerase/L-lactate dehydrogenase-like FMN-dependent dehydrogenase